MARYGRDFGGGNRHYRSNMGDIGIGYDEEFFGGSGRNQRNAWPGRRDGWGSDAPSGGCREPRFGRQGGLDEAWGSTAHGHGRQPRDEGRFGGGGQRRGGFGP